jgi:hypothetical protein
MPTYRIFYTVTECYSEYVEAETLEQAVEKWDSSPKKHEDEGAVDFDPYTYEYFDCVQENKRNIK